MSTSLIVSPRRSPLIARISASVLNELRHQIERSEGSGLLLGRTGENGTNIEALAPFPQAKLPASFVSKTDSLEVIGWYSVRARHSALLLETDFGFHEQHFPKPTDIALIFSRKGKQEILVKVYARSAEARSANEEFRSGSARLPLRQSTLPAIEVPIGSSVNPDSYLKVYDLARTLDKADRHAEGRAGALKKISWLGFAALLLAGIAAIRVSQRPATAVANEPAARFEPAPDSPDDPFVRHKAEPVVPSAVQDAINSAALGARRLPDLVERNEYLDPGTDIRRRRAAKKFPLVTLVQSSPHPAQTHIAPIISPPVLETASSTPPQGSLPSFVPGSIPSIAPPPSGKSIAPQQATGGHLMAVPEESRDYTPPQPLTQHEPTVPSSVLASLASPVKIEVEVKIDKSGHVTKAHALSAASANSAIVRAAVAAAREWVFQPATLRGQNVSSQHTIVFQFRGN